MTEDNDTEILLRVENLKQYFGSGEKVMKAVDGISFDVRRAEVFSLVGESGCGKTTTGRSIIGLYKITDGRIYFDGECIAAGALGCKEAVYEAKREIKKAKNGYDIDIRVKKIKKNREKLATAEHNLREAKRIMRYGRRKSAYNPKDIQMVFQDPMSSLDPRMTVGEIIAEGLVIGGGVKREEIRERVFEMLELVGLPRECYSRYPHEFSGGQRQRIGIARALIMKPRLVIADEPVSALDVSVQAQIINLLNGLKEKLGLTVLFVAHDLSVVKYFSDRIGVMYGGKLMELAGADELFSNPLHPYTKSLLSAIPRPDPEYERKRQRIVYSYEDCHDYRTEAPSMRQIKKDHFVYCSEREAKEYKKECGAV